MYISAYVGCILKFQIKMYIRAWILKIVLIEIEFNMHFHWYKILVV